MVKESVDIIEADLDDPRHQEAVRALIDMYAADRFGKGEGLSNRVRRELIPGLRRHPARIILLAYHGDQPMGIMVGFIGFSTFQARPLINIHDLAVTPSHRGRGLGRQLLEATEERARARGCCKLTLEVKESNERALHLYRDFGFGDGPLAGSEARLLFLEKHLESV